jgi:molecular chaperone DnaJ
VVKVETPTKLTARQKELLRELQETETGDECPESRGFFDKLKEAFGG